MPTTPRHIYTNSDDAPVGSTLQTLLESLAERGFAPARIQESLVATELDHDLDVEEYLWSRFGGPAVDWLEDNLHPGSDVR